jgi:MFS family permease
VDLTFLRDRPFWVWQFFNTIQALGYFLPVNYLPTIAEQLGLSRTLGSLTVLLVNLGMVFGCLGVGVLVDRFDVTAVLLAVSIISAFTVWAILGLTTVTAPLFIFSIMYGLTASTYSTHWGGMIRELQKKHEGTDANLVFGLFALGRGVGSIISGPLSESLYAGGRVWHDSASSAYVTEYGPIIIFSGCTACVGGFSWFVRKAGFI